MWYEVKVKYLKIGQDGFEKTVTHPYLLDAVSYTDAEARIFEIMKEITRSDFQVKNIKQSNIGEVISKDDGEYWYKARIKVIVVDEESGKERKSANYILVMGNNAEDALKQLDDGLSYMLVPYEVTGIQLSPIVDVFPYVPGENKS